MENKRMAPLMGWASWNNYSIHISEEIIKKQIDAIIGLGLNKVGYTYVNIDDGFFGGRGSDGLVKAHPKRFPNGMKVIADYAHENGLFAGIYSDAGDNTCSHMYNDKDSSDGVGVGLYLHDEEDLRQYLIDWDFDYIKVDWCGGKRLGLDEEDRYTTIGKIIASLREEKGKDIFFNVCRWQFPGEWVTSVADSWRISSDISLNFKSVMIQLEKAAVLAKYQSPGHQNDLDMLEVGRGLTYEEDKTHFAMWCMMSCPLLLGNDLTAISQETLSIIKNERLIAINQDDLCAPARRIYKSRKYDIWVKDLNEPDKKAFAAVNKSKKPLKLRLMSKKTRIGNAVEITDLWNGQTVSSLAGDTSIEPHGTAVYTVSGAFDSSKLSKLAEKFGEAKRPLKPQKKLRAKRQTVYIDVRTRGEYSIRHIDGAINIPHTDIPSEIEKAIPDKKTRIVVFCSTGKRSSQAKVILEYLGYTDVVDRGEAADTLSSIKEL